MLKCVMSIMTLCNINGMVRGTYVAENIIEGGLY